MTKADRKSRFAEPRGKDQAVAQAVAAESEAGAWAELRGGYSPRIRGIVDGILARGGLSLADIAALELAEHERMGEEIDDLAGLDKATTAIASLRSVRLQARKHMRTLRLLMNPVGTPDTVKARAPKKVTERHRQAGIDAGDNLLDHPTTKQLEA